MPRLCYLLGMDMYFTHWQAVTGQRFYCNLSLSDKIVIAHI